MQKSHNHWRINLGKDMAGFINAKKEVFLYLDSLKQRDYLIISSSDSDDQSLFLIAKVAMDQKCRISLPKKVVSALGWEDDASLLVVKRQGRLYLYKI